ncbi:pectate lyase family protein [Novosphingobium mangrovi (ex Hu et al. 2023)]|uniref:Pectate lyase n=1 Tax=Novosphingobium mangrovi (ex Hu et al. 2023) TaxID=2930094 RepID=A0ABT0ABY5_9SPHN|nr:pectate lyase [Novosphingobium mangrovi (ex Hu et al. 2023)]MCJ1960702.1 pectate lyase [Novosphingobium mangrovi (ex Hu et al. 2023)]
MAGRFMAKRGLVFAGLFGLALADCAPPSAAASAPVVKTPSGQKAFPGAVGYGAVSAGGRGGRIIYVTTLADGGPGSLRSCIDYKFPRVCVFRVNGVIRFTQRPPRIRYPYITIAGQTAPGGGITLSHNGGANGQTPLVIKNSHDVVVRHIRVRNDKAGKYRGAEDNITIENSSKVIIDHVSTSWSRDEGINGYADNDLVTISNSIFAWGIPKHDKCALLASDPRDKQNLSFINNICAHNGDRNPDINFPRGSCVEVVNNILYNAQSEFAEVWETYGGSPVSIVSNTFLAGNNTNTNSRGIARETIGSTGRAQIYLWGNKYEGNFKHISPEVDVARVQDGPCPLTITPQTANASFYTVLARSGAFPRDSIDDEILSDVRNRTGQIGSPAPSLPYQPAANPYPDADKDGMDDSWEASHGANPAKSDAWADANGNGVSNFEDFLTSRERGFGL